MRIHRVSRVLLIALLATASLQAQTRVATLAPLPTATPESVGFAPGALDKMDAGMQDLVDKKQLAGIVTLVARKGKVVQHKAYGVASFETGAPMKLDTIGRIYSMTKPITGVAMMMLYKDGRWKPTDPIAKHIPEFANLKVYAGEKDGQPILEEPVHPPTMAELMSHSAGFTYGIFGSTPVDMMYRANNPLEAPSLQEMINRLSKLPLQYQPGTRWVYSVSVDIQGYLVEKLSGKAFPEFLRTRLFEPLGMVDTAFYVQAEKLSRVSPVYAYDKAKAGLVVAEPIQTTPPALASGGGGLYGTAADYFRFAQMMLNGGEYNGKRFIKKSTVELMHTNALTDQVRAGNYTARFAPGQGFGYDFALVLEPDVAKRQVSAGTFYWWGVAGTWFWIDPANDVIFVGIIQRRGGFPGAASHEDISRRVIAEALPKS